MAAEDALNTQQFEGRGWTPIQVTNMAKLARSNAIGKARRARVPQPTKPLPPVQSMQNWY